MVVVQISYSCTWLRLSSMGWWLCTKRSAVSGVEDGVVWDVVFPLWHSARKGWWRLRESIRVTLCRDWGFVLLWRLKNTMSKYLFGNVNDNVMKTENDAMHDSDLKIKREQSSPKLIFHRKHQLLHGEYSVQCIRW